MNFSQRLLATALCLSAPALVAQGPQVDASLPLFTVMAAAAAADSKGEVYNNAFAQQLRKDLTGKEIPSLDEIRRFLAFNKADYTRLVSFALVIDGPPDFGFRYREDDLPMDAQELLGLNNLLTHFYQEAGIPILWDKYKPQFDAQEALYQDGIARVMLTVNGYLRNPSQGFYGRSFSVYIDMLGPPNQVNARSFENDYYVVVTASPELHSDEIRHGYLHYVLEPLALKEGSAVRLKDKLLDTAQRAPALDRNLRRNFSLFLTESLIRAVELRMTKLSDTERANQARDAAQEGHFMVPYFLEMLLKYEQQDAGMRIYYPKLIEGIDVAREERRARDIPFRATANPRSLSEFADVRRANSDTDSILAEGEDAMARHDLPRARHAYQTALDNATMASGDQRAHSAARARALFGLALVATEAKQGEVAKTFFQQTVEAARDPQLLGWAHVYLGRLLDMENRRDAALKQYRQALETGNITANVRQAAQKGLEAPFTKPQGNDAK